MTIADSHDVSRILGGIDFLSACGQPVDEPWGISRPKDMREAILDHAMFFGAFLLLRDREMCRMVPEWRVDPERHFMDAFGQISGPVEQLVKSCIWPRLPSALRRVQFKNLFKYQLGTVVIERCLVERGLAPGVFGLLLRAYEMGHFPCDWEGGYPQGRLVIY